MWELIRGLNPYGLAIAVSDNGLQFSVPQLIPGSADPAGGFNGSTQGLLLSKMAVRADGEIAVGNSTVR